MIPHPARKATKTIRQKMSVHERLLTGPWCLLSSDNSATSNKVNQYLASTPAWIGRPQHSQLICFLIYFSNSSLPAPFLFLPLSPSSIFFKMSRAHRGFSRLCLVISPAVSRGKYLLVPERKSISSTLAWHGFWAQILPRMRWEMARNHRESSGIRSRANGTINTEVEGKTIPTIVKYLWRMFTKDRQEFPNFGPGGKQFSSQISAGKWGKDNRVIITFIIFIIITNI